MLMWSDCSESSLHLNLTTWIFIFFFSALKLSQSSILHTESRWVDRWSTALIQQRTLSTFTSPWHQTCWINQTDWRKWLCGWKWPLSFSVFADITKSTFVSLLHEGKGKRTGPQHERIHFMYPPDRNEGLQQTPVEYKGLVIIRTGICEVSGYLCHGHGRRGNSAASVHQHGARATCTHHVITDKKSVRERKWFSTVFE